MLSWLLLGSPVIAGLLFILLDWLYPEPKRRHFDWPPRTGVDGQYMPWQPAYYVLCEAILTKQRLYGWIKLKGESPAYLDALRRDHPNADRLNNALEWWSLVSEETDLLFWYTAKDIGPLTTLAALNEESVPL